MQIASWAASLIAVAMLAACQPAGDSSETGAPAAVAEDEALFALAGGAVVVPVAIETDRVDMAAGHRVTEIHRWPDGTALVLDAWDSRPEGLSRCQGGREVWARLLSAPARAERWSALVESCLRDVEPGDPPVSLSADGRTVTVTRLPGTDLPERESLTLDEAGQPEL